MLADKKNLTDEQLFKLYQNGDEEAFKVFYDRHSAKVYGFLKSRLKHKETVAEIFQEVFIKIHKSKHQYNDSFPALAWIFAVTRTVMLDQLRKNKKNEKINDDGLGQISESFEKADSQYEKILDNIANLPEQQKTAIQMRYVDEKTFEEIATSLNISSVNARQIISRGLKRLKELVSDKEGL